MAGRLRRNAVHFRAHDSTHDQDRGPEFMPEGSTGHPPHADTSHSQVETPDVPVLDSGEGNSHQASITSEDQRARKLVKTILDQGYLSPFPLSIRPVLWDHASALQLYPLPTALILMDPEAPTFTVTYQGCHAMNPGPLISTVQKGVAQWIEYDARTRRGHRKEVRL